MRRLALALVLWAIVAGSVAGSAGGATVTWQVAEDGNTRPLRGYVQYTTVTLYGGMGPMRTVALDATGTARLTLPLPIACWSGTEQCVTLDGQWLYWTVVPWAFPTCTPLEPATGDDLYRGVTWVDVQDSAWGFILQGECEP